MIWKRWRYDVDRDSTEQLKGKEIERKRLAILTVRYLQYAMQQRQNNDVLATGQCVITRILWSAVGVQLLNLSILWSAVGVQLLNLSISSIILNKAPCWKNKMFREFAVAVHTVTGFSRGCSCSCSCSDRSAKEMVKLLPQYSWSEYPNVSKLLKWVSHCFSIRVVINLLFQYSWSDQPTVSVFVKWSTYCFRIREVSSPLFQYSWSEQRTVLIFVKWSAHCLKYLWSEQRTVSIFVKWSAHCLKYLWSEQPTVSAGVNCQPESQYQNT